VAPFFDWCQSLRDFPTEGATFQLSTKNCISPFVPIYHVSVTPSEFAFLDHSIFIKISTFFSISTFVPLLIVAIILYLIGLKVSSRCFVVFLLSWITLAGFLFPLVQSDGMVEATKALVNNRHFVLVLLLSVIFSLVALTKLFYVPVVFCTVIIFASLIPSLPTFLKVCSTSESVSPSGVTEVSTEKNIFVISFDGIPGTVVRNVFEDYPELSEAFKDFAFFTNAVSQAPATHASIRSELFGNRNYHSIASTNKTLDALLDLNSLPLNNIQDSFTYGSYNGYNLNSKNKIAPLSFSQISQREKIKQHLYWMELLLARTGTPSFPIVLKGVDLFESMKRWLSSSNNLDNDLSLKLDNYVGPSWKRGFIQQIQDYFWFVDNLNATKKGLSIRYMHFTYSHYPVDFDEESTFRGNDLLWHRANQNYHGLYNQSKGVLFQFKRFVEKLKRLGIYDNSLIVFKSDHGEPSIYYETFPNDMQINGHELWGVDRYMPLLMVKDFSRNKSHIEYKSDLVTLPDLSKTLCIAAQVKGVDCSNFPGLNLLGDYEITDSPIFYIETVTGPKSTFEFDTHQTIQLKRSQRKFHEILMSSGLVDLNSRSQSMLNRRLKFSESILFTVDGNVSDFVRFGWSNQEPTHRWTDGSQAKLVFRLQDQPDENLLLRLKASAYLGGGLPYQTIDVAVNGQKTATWKMKGKWGKWDWYEATIPSNLVGKDRLLEVLFNISNPTSPAEVGESKDTRKLGIAARELMIVEKGKR